MATAELLFQLRGDPSNVKSVLAQVRSELSETGNTADTVNKKQIQNSVAIIAQWKQEEQTAARVQREIEAAHKQREQQVSRIAQQEAQAWTRHENQKLAATRQAEKQGEQTVAQSAAAKEAAARRSETARTQATRRALQDIARIEKERAQIMAQNSKAIEAQAKHEADVRIREGRRAANNAIALLAQAGQVGRGAGGAQPVGEVFRGLNQAIITMQGPLGGIASRVSSLTGLLSGLALGAGAVAIAIGAMAAAAIGGAVAFFRLVQSVSEATGKLHDLSQQVGVSVETLSTLDVLASTTGGNIDTVTASLALFQRNLEDAHDPTSKEAKLLKELGVTSLDTEVALRQAIRGLFALGEGAKQTDASIQLFGRSGRFVNAILKESKGDLDAATERFQKMGLIIGGPAAAAADRFNDSLEILERQLGAVSRTLVSDTIPVFIAFFEQLSGMLTGNKNEWQSWASTVETSVAGVLATIQGAILAAATGQFIDAKRFTDLFFDSLIARSRQVRNEIFAQSEIDRFGRVTDQILGRGGRPGDRPDTETGKSQAQARANKALQLELQALEETLRVRQAILERDRELDLKSIEEWEEESINILTRRLGRTQDIFEKERENARRFIQDREDQSLALREIDQKDEKAQNDFALSVQRIQDEARRRKDQSALRIERQLAAIREVEREGELRRIEDALERQEITEAEAITRRLALEKQAQADRLILLNAELESETTSLERKTEIINEKIRLEQKYTDETKRLIQERNAAREREIANQAPGAKGVPEQRPPIEVLPGELPPPPDFNPWKDAIEQLRKQLADFSQFVSGTVVEAINGIGRALGDGLAAWILYGEGFGKAMRQSLALVAAKIAAEAALQAVLHAAYAIGSLAFGNYAAAAKHAIAAAKFGALAAGAAIIGRGIAGNSFTSGSSGGGGGSGSGGTREPPQPITTIIRGRGQEPSPTVRHIFEVRVVDSELGPAINAHIVRNVGDGGQLREVMQRDGR